MLKLKTFFLSLMASMALLNMNNALAASETNAPVADKPVATEATPSKVENVAAPSVVVADKVNLNTATAEELKQALKGVGTKKAQAIVDYREQHGNFTAVEQLTEVKGIGPAIFEKNKDRITF